MIWLGVLILELVVMYAGALAWILKAWYVKYARGKKIAVARKIKR
jgi:hypothetical protein